MVPDVLTSLNQIERGGAVATIFISYAQADRDHARRLAEFLQASGYSVWWDAGLRPGDVFTIEIQRQINDCKHFVVLWSRVSTASFWVTAETTYARTAGKPILPLKIDDCTPPVPFNLLQTKELTSIDVAGPVVAEALLCAGTLPTIARTSRPGAEVEETGENGQLMAGIVRKAQELARWEFIKDSKSAADFRTFLNRFPDGDLADLATMRLESLAWDEASRDGLSLPALDAFLAEFPNGVQAPEARRLAGRLRRAQEHAHWARLRPGRFFWSKRAGRRLADYQQFLQLYPDGIHAEQAKAMIQRFERELELWREAALGKDLAAVERYLEEFPYGDHAPEAKAHRSRLRRQLRTTTSNQPTRPKLPWTTLLSLAVLAFLLGCLGGWLGVRSEVFVVLPFKSLSGETIYFLHPYPILIGVFLAFLIHEWGNRSWVTTLFAFTAVLLFRAASQLIGPPEVDNSGLPLNAMVTGALYCFGAWVAGFIVAPYMRRSVITFVVSIVLGALAYPDWLLLMHWQVEGHEVLSAGVFFAACTMPIAFSLLRASPEEVPEPAVAAAPTFSG
jgi:hypothetical protein